MRATFFVCRQYCVGVILLFSVTGLFNTAYAQAISTMTIDWSSFSVRKSSTINGTKTDITNSLIWSNQADLIDYRYWDADPGNVQTSHDDQNPNPGWAAFNSSLNTAATSSSATGDPNTISTTANSSYYSESWARIFRTGDFVAPEDGYYEFSVDYSLYAELNSVHTEENGADIIFARPAASLLYARNGGTTTGTFAFVETDPNLELFDNFSTVSTSGTLLLDNIPATGNTIFFQAGDIISIAAKVRSNSESYSTQPIPTPIPAALPLMITGLVGLFGIAKRKSA